MLNDGFPTQGASFNASEVRYDLSGLVYRNRFGDIRDGLIWPVPGSILTPRTSMGVDVNNFNAVASRDGGAVWLSNRGVVTVPLEAAPASGARIDVIYAKQNDASLAVGNPDATNDPILGVIKGVAQPLPYKPQELPEAAVELGTVYIPAGATSTQSAGVVMTNSSKYTALAGNPIPCYDEDQGLIGLEASNGDRVMRLDQGGQIWTWYFAGKPFNNNSIDGWYANNSITTRFRDGTHSFLPVKQVNPMLFNKVKSQPDLRDWHYDVATGDFVCARPGTYLIRFMWTMGVQGVVAPWEVNIEGAGEVLANQGPSASTGLATSSSISATRAFVMGDKVRVSIYCTVGVGFDVSNPNRTQIQLIRLGGVS